MEIDRVWPGKERFGSSRQNQLVPLFPLKKMLMKPVQVIITWFLGELPYTACGEGVMFQNKWNSSISLTAITIVIQSWGGDVQVIYFWRESQDYLDTIIMRTFVCFQLVDVSVFIRRQQLTPKLSISSFGRGHVYRKAQMTPAAFKQALHLVHYGDHPNMRNIKMIMLGFWKEPFSKIPP